MVMAVNVICLARCDVMYSARNLPTFWRNLLLFPFVYPVNWGSRFLRNDKFVLNCMVSRPTRQ